MNILLVLPLGYPYHDVVYQDVLQEWEKKLSRVKIKRPEVAYPNGILSIAAYISKDFPDADIRILDFNLLVCDLADNDDSIFSMSREDFWGYCLSLTSGFAPDIIGVSLMFCSMYEEFFPLADFLRKNYAEAIIIAGGHLASASYKELFQSTSSLDAVCYGEGEIPFSELLSAMQSGGGKAHMESDDSWITRNKLFCDESLPFVMPYMPRNKLIYNLDEIPPYRLETVVKWELYLIYAKNPIFRITSEDTKSNFQMFTTRGCPGRCVFCASQNIHGHKIRHYSAERVKNDVMLYTKHYGIESIVFFDDHFLGNKQRALEILNFVTDNHIAISVLNPPFFSIDEEIADALKKAGETEIVLAIENANEDTLKHIIHKPGSLSRAKQAIRILRDKGFLVTSNILTGFPGETKESINKGVISMLDLECDWYTCFVVAPLPGSELYDICKKDGYLLDGADVYKMDFKKCVIQTPEFTAEYIEKRVYEINLYVNFVKNYNMRVGKYELALKFFERILTNVVDTHAFAYYYSAICARKLGLEEKAELYTNKYYEIWGKFSFWREWAEYFELDSLREIRVYFCFIARIRV